MKDNEKRNGFRRINKEDQQKEPDKVALLLLNTIKEQVREFLQLEPEERFDGAKALYTVGSYPAVLESEAVPEASNFDVYQLERTVRLRKDEPDHMNRLSTAILLINKETAKPAYYLTAYITPKLIANIRVVLYNDRGPSYGNSISWDSRDDEETEAAE